MKMTDFDFDIMTSYDVIHFAIKVACFELQVSLFLPWKKKVGKNNKKKGGVIIWFGKNEYICTWKYVIGTTKWNLRNKYEIVFSINS